MFTVKLIGVDYQHVFAVKSYEVQERFSPDCVPSPVIGATIILDGTEYHVGNHRLEDRPFDSCFVENIAGKTIARIGPFPSLVPCGAVPVNGRR